jgi:hypothetical protein
LATCSSGIVGSGIVGSGIVGSGSSGIVGSSIVGSGIIGDERGLYARVVENSKGITAFQARDAIGKA